MGQFSPETISINYGSEQVVNLFLRKDSALIYYCTHIHYFCAKIRKNKENKEILS